MIKVNSLKESNNSVQSIEPHESHVVLNRLPIDTRSIWEFNLFYSGINSLGKDVTKENFPSILKIHIETLKIG